MDILEAEVATLEVEMGTLEAAVVATLGGTGVDIPGAVTGVGIPGATGEATLEAAEVVTLEEAEVVTLEVEMATLEAAEAAIQGGMAAIQGGMAATPEAEVVVKATLATVVTNINREQPSPSAAILDRHVVSPRFIETRKDLPPPLRHPPPTNSSERSGEPLCPRIDGQTAVDETTKGGRIEDGSRGDRRPWIEPPPSSQQASRKSGKVKKTVSKTV